MGYKIWQSPDSKQRVEWDDRLVVGCKNTQPRPVGMRMFKFHVKSFLRRPVGQ